MLPGPTTRQGGDWPAELEALREDPVMMLLAAVVWRARQDARDSGSARRFLKRVKRLCEQRVDPAYAVLSAMTGDA